MFALNAAAVSIIVLVLVARAEKLGPFGFRCVIPLQHPCKTEFSELELDLDSFEVDVGRYPTDKEGLSALLDAPLGMESRWHGPYIKPRLLRDPWGRPYRYHRGSKAHNEDYWLVSCGPDGIEGTADDMTNY